MTITLTHGICFHTDEGQIVFALGHDVFRVQVNDQIIAELPRECGEDVWRFLECNLFNERHLPNEYTGVRTETD